MLASASFCSSVRADQIFGDATGFFQYAKKVQGGDPPETSWNVTPGPASLVTYVSGWDYAGTGLYTKGWSSVSFDVSDLDPDAPISLYVPIIFVQSNYATATVTLSASDSRLWTNTGPPVLSPSDPTYQLSLWDLNPEIDLGMLSDLGFLAGHSHLVVTVTLNDGFAETPFGATGLFDAPYLEATRSHVAVCEPSSLSLAALGMAGMASWRRRRRRL